MKPNDKQLSKSSIQKGSGAEVQHSTVAKRIDKKLFDCPGCGLMSFISYKKETA